LLASNEPVKSSMALYLEKLQAAKTQGSVLVSQPVKIKEPVPHISKEDFKVKLDDLLKSIKKDMWAPEVLEVTELVRADPKFVEDITQSKYFGSPWLYAKEGWPDIEGQPAVFVMQLNIASLPEEMSKKLGHTGLLQFFYQPNGSGDGLGDEALVRIVDIKKVGKTLPQPKVVDYVIPNEQLIVGWTHYEDYPHSTDLDEIDEYVDLQDLAEGNNINLDSMMPDCYQGDKLGGWPFWTQASFGSEGYLYQIDAGCFFDGNSVPAYAPGLFAGDGTGHIAGDRESLSFMWACT
jgi:hypothetical protein